MVGILLITHYKLGESLLECASHVLGQAPANIVALPVERDVDPDAALQAARTLLARVDEGAGVLVLSDMLGGTPANIASRLAVAGQVEVVFGVNLPMLVRAASYAACLPLAEVKAKALSGGGEGVQAIDQGQGKA